MASSQHLNILCSIQFWVVNLFCAKPAETFQIKQPQITETFVLANGYSTYLFLLSSHSSQQTLAHKNYWYCKQIFMVGVWQHMILHDENCYFGFFCSVILLAKILMQVLMLFFCVYLYLFYSYFFLPQVTILAPEGKGTLGLKPC